MSKKNKQGYPFSTATTEAPLCESNRRETVRNQPITRVRAKLGVELDRKRAREKRVGESWRREGTAAHMWRRGEGESCYRQSSAVEEARPSTGRGGGWKVWKILERERGDCVILSLMWPRTLGDLQAVWLGILLQKLRKTEKRCLTHKSSKLTQQDVFCDLERERKQVDTTLEAVDMATFFKLKA